MNPLLPMALSLVMAFGCSSSPKAADSDTPQADPTPQAEPDKAPPDAAPLDADAANALAKANFEAFVAKIDAYHTENEEYPATFDVFWTRNVVDATLMEPKLSSRENVKLLLENKEYFNPFSPGGTGHVWEDHSFLGLEQGSFTYAPILMPDGSQGGYVFLGYGDNGGEPPPDAIVDTFFSARNFVEYNKAGTNPRLPNDVPEHTIFAAFKRGTAGVDPPADYEAPPQESLVSQQEDTEDR